MSATDDIETAIRKLREEHAAAIQVHRADAKAMVDLTTRLKAASEGQITDVDMPRLIAEINDAAQELHQGLVDTHVTAADVQTANQGQSYVQGGSMPPGDVVSASSPGVIKPAPTDLPNSDVPSSLGGGAMAAPADTSTDTPKGDPASDEAGKRDAPDVPNVDDVPTDVSDTSPAKSGKKK